MKSRAQCSLLACLLVFATSRGTSANYVEEYEDHFTNDFVVQIDGDSMVADLVARSYGFHNAHQIQNLGDNMFHFIHEDTSHRSRRSAQSVLQKLTKDPNVLYVEQQKVLVRQKRRSLQEDRYMVYDKQTELDRPAVDQDVILERYFGSSSKRAQNPCHGTVYEKGLMNFNDKFYCLQWYYNNNGQTKGKRGYDINVQEAWKKYTGKGVVVTVLDDGLNHEHPEIRDNYDKEASYDLNDLDDREHDPQPPTSSSTTAHGTRCAGEIAGVANNGVCGVGVAFEASIGGVRILDGSVTDKTEAQALSFKRDYIDIYSASWGPRDNGKTMEQPHTLTNKALQMGAEQGRAGKGSIFAWATGNGGSKDDCNADGYVSSIYTISIGCINDEGLSTYFSEICSSTHAVIFTGGSNKAPGEDGYDKPDISIITADVGTSSTGGPNCDLDFEGTSSAAPLAAGCFALVLQANMDLTWRDMQHLIVETARVPNPHEGGWVYNGAGYHLNHKFGFGSINCGGMVSLATTWHQVNEHLKCEIAQENEQLEVEGGGHGSQTITVTSEDCDIERLEHSVVLVRFTTTYRGDMSFHVTSPSGTDSEVLSTRPLDDFEGEFHWRFMTTHNWNERCTGDWVLSLEDQGPESRAHNNKFVIKEWSLELYGTNGDDPNKDVVRANKTTRVVEKQPDQACELPTNSLHELMDQERQEQDQLNRAMHGGEPFTRDSMATLVDSLDERERKELEQFVAEQLLNDDSSARYLNEALVEQIFKELNPSDDSSDLDTKSTGLSTDGGYDELYNDKRDNDMNNGQHYKAVDDHNQYLQPENRELESDVEALELQESIDLIQQILASLDQ